MASTHFWYAPTTGTGSTTVSVSADTMNSDGGDRLATIAITNGAVSKNVTVKQRYRPVMQQFGSSTFPATGGTIYFTVSTEYDIVFRSVPDWITIKKDNVTYAEGQRIASGTANGTFSLIAAANPETQSRSVGSTFNMAHYVGNTMPQYYSYFSFTQEGQEPQRNMYIRPILVEATSAQTTATLTLTCENCTFSSMTVSTAGTFAITASNPSNNTITITFPSNTTYAERRGYASFYLYNTQHEAFTTTVTVVQAANGGIATSVDTLIFDYNETAAKQFSLSAGTNWSSTITDNDE